MRIMLHKIKQYLAPFIKFLVIAGCGYYLIAQWQERPLQLHTIKSLFQNLAWYVIPCMALLSLGSWLVESKKWQVLVSGLYGLRYSESVLQNLTAQAASFVTPLRVGEVVFKALFYKTSLRKEIAGRTVVGNMVQMFVTSVLGMVGALLLLKSDITAIFYVLFVTILISILLIVIVLWAWKKYQLEMLSKRLLATITSLSLMRYVLFAANWVLILQVLNYDTTLLNSMLHVAAMYLLISIIPIIPLGDVAVRLTMAAMIFEESAVLSETILFATLVVWCTNTLLPTLLGCALLPFTRFKAAVA
jgi:uncharacterized membrane protein YbhN (UPF0104 family)